jgi:hypothetical protein
MAGMLLSGAIGTVGGLACWAWADFVGVTIGQAAPLVLIGMLLGAIAALIGVLSA